MAFRVAGGVSRGAARPHHTERLRLLTYPAASASPLLHAAAEPAGAVVPSHRWVRDAEELCIARLRRSDRLHRLQSYVATYKFDDPHWQAFLLPEVHVLPRAASAGDADSVPGSEPRGGSAPVEVFIDYNKLTNVELLARHANYALRHLVQKGHAMYLVNYAQHSILEMRGLIETSFINCAYGIRGERLRTHITHIGPLDVRDVLEVDAEQRRVHFDLARPHVRRGVVAVSIVEGYGTWFQRKPMLWQRTRRIGALQSQLGAYDYHLAACEQVGRLRDVEVSLFEPHLRFLGSGGSAGAEALAMVASSQVAQNPRLYMGQFEAPAVAALDAVHQLAHHSALRHRLLRPVEAANAADAAPRRRVGMERLLPVSWVTRTPPPYVPLEADLPFKVQLSRPTVFAGPAALAATGGTVGSPLLSGAPLSLFEYHLHQGVDHYVFDDAPSARPMKWWNQKSNMPYNGYLYCMRSGLLDRVGPSEAIPNPLAPRSRRRTTPRPSHAAATVDDDDAETAMAATAEVLSPGSRALQGHDDADRAARPPAEAEDSPPSRLLHEMIPPNETAAGRAERYARYAARRPSRRSGDDNRTSLEQRQRRQSRARSAAEARPPPPPPPSSSSND